MSRPRARSDLATLTIPKAAAAQPQALRSPAAAGKGPPAGPKALTVKLDGETYWRLRRYCLDQGERSGIEPTHQEVLTAALAAYLPQ